MTDMMNFTAITTMRTLMLVFVLTTISTAGYGSMTTIGPGGISGPTAVTEGETREYSYSSTQAVDPCWSVTGAGHVVSSWSSSTVYYVTVQWTSPGTGTIQFLQSSCSTLVATLSVNVAGYVPNPSTSFSFSYTCLNTVVTRAGTPDSKYEWYWQTSSGGTSLSIGKDASITLTATTPLYLRARRRDYPNDWSTPQSVGTVVVYPSAPAAPTVAHNGGAFAGSPVTMSVEGPEEALSYKWYYVSENQYGTAIAGVTTNTYTVILTETRDFYVSAETVCESKTRLRVTGTVEPLPVIVVERGGYPVINMGGSINLTTSKAYETYAWRNATGDVVGTTRTFAAAAAGSYTVTVTKSGISGAGLSQPITVTSGLGDLDMNYVHTIMAQAPIDAVDEGSVDVNTQSVAYFDGLGRPVQNVGIQASPSHTDMVQPVVYNYLGLETQKYAPFTAERSGIYKPAIVNPSANDKSYTGLAANFYADSTDAVADDDMPYSTTVFEASPLNRVLKQGAPGAAWQPTTTSGTDHSVKLDYTSNTANDIMRWEANYDTGIPVQAGYYAANTLAVKATLDEHNNAILEYTNPKGQMVTKRVQYGTGTDGIALYAETYYIYDDFGSLITVLPPEAVKALQTN